MKYLSHANSYAFLRNATVTMVDGQRFLTVSISETTFTAYTGVGIYTTYSVLVMTRVLFYAVQRFTIK